MLDPDRLLDILRALNREGVEYAIFGAVALGLHGLARATEAIDLFVRPTPENVERLRRALRSVWDDPSIDEITAEDLAGDYPSIRYGPPDGLLSVDLVSRLGTAFTWDDLETVEVEFEGETVRAVSPATLYRMKRGTVRPQDQVDAEALRRHLGCEDD